jgi:DNA-binding LacI/PurR family transcriptional regulator
MGKMATIKDVAKLAGVSISTVSRTLSNKIFVEEETRKKVLQAVRELEYKPNIMAQSLKEGKTKTLALLVPDINSLFYPMLMKSIEKYATEKSYSLILANSNEDVIQEKHNLDMLQTRYVDGIICLSVTDEISHILKVYRKGNIPVVFVNRNFNEDVNCVLTDNRYGGYVTTKYLLEHGHRKISCMFGDFNNQRFRQRYEGCICAMEEFGVKDYEKYFIFGVNSIEDAYSKTVEILKREDKPTAFFASIDILAVGIYSGINQSNMSIPDDISVVGYDNIFITPYMVPPLTTYDTLVDDLGKESVNCLVRQIENKGTGKSERIILKGSLVTRDSVKAME